MRSGPGFLPLRCYVMIGYPGICSLDGQQSRAMLHMGTCQ